MEKDLYKAKYLQELELNWLTWKEYKGELENVK